MQEEQNVVSRRDFIRANVLGTGALMAGAASGAKVFAVGEKRRPNFALITCDQLLFNALSSYGCTSVRTPNIDRLVGQGVSFMGAHSTSPVCSPARSSWLTGRMPVETGVISNNRAINSSVPTMGTWFRQNGYETVYTGKHHLPYVYPAQLSGWTIMPNGEAQGDLADPVTSCNCETYLRTRNGAAPFVLFAGLVQPHDICYYFLLNETMVPADPPFPQLQGDLPQLPPNNRVIPREPKMLSESHFRARSFTDAQWRYYLYCYYRMIEMLDADVGRILDALEDTGHMHDTVIIFTSDHGEGAGRHSLVNKWYPYEESVKTPLVIRCPYQFQQGFRDERHLVSELDIMPTMCDFADIDPPPQMRGRSLRPLLEGRSPEWRDFVAAEVQLVGRMIRTERYKYVKYPNDPVEQLFDMKADPWETENLFEQPRLADTLDAHRRLLREWEATLAPVQPSDDMTGAILGKPQS